MKIKLTIQDVPDKEYVTIDPSPIAGPAYTGNILTLEDVCDKAEATEILGDKILDYIPHSLLLDAVSSWCTLLRHGGKLILGGINTNEISRLWLTKHIQPEEYNRYVFGDGSVKKASLHSIEQVEKVMRENGLKITRKSLPGVFFIIEGQRQ